MNILYITIKSTNDNGGHYVSERNFMTLKQIYGERNIHLHQIKFSIFSIALSLLSFSLALPSCSPTYIKGETGPKGEDGKDGKDGSIFLSWRR